MDFWSLLLVAIGLAMDAFAVSICKGLSQKKLYIKTMLIVGGWFGIFQGLMPLLGYYLSSIFSGYVEKFAPYISFVLLLIIGLNMIRESLHKSCDECSNPSLGVKVMLPLAIATSIDAFATGVTFALMDVKILYAVALIAVITFVISGIGVLIGNLFGSKFKSKAEFIGGVILVLIGLKILFEGIFS